MQKKSPKRIRVSYRKQVERLNRLATVLFILYLCLAGLFLYEMYLFSVKGPDPYYIDNETGMMMCHCYLWGCYCCPEEYNEVLVHDWDTNMTNIAKYKGCTKSEYLPADWKKPSFEELSCKELIDYYTHGRRCTGIFKSRCIYPYIWNEKAVLEEQIRQNNCAVSIK